MALDSYVSKPDSGVRDSDSDGRTAKEENPVTELENKLKHGGEARRAAARSRAATSSSWPWPRASPLTAGNLMFTKAARAEPKKGGTFKIGLRHGATTDSLDPGLYYDQFTGTACWGTLSNSLTEIDAEGNVVPDLAESFEPSDGAKKWVFKLRKGVDLPQWQAGDRRRRRGLDHASPRRGLEVGRQVAARAGDVGQGRRRRNGDLRTGRRQCRLPLHRVRLSHPDHAEEGRRHGRLVVRHPHRRLHAREVRAGRASRPSRRIRTTSSPTRAGSTRSNASSIKDVTARTNALTAGETHYLHRADLKTLDLLKQNPNVVIFEVTGYGHYIYVMNVTAAALRQPGCAQRHQVLDQPRRDPGTRSSSAMARSATTIRSRRPSSSPSIREPKHAYDPEKAKEPAQEGRPRYR